MHICLCQYLIKNQMRGIRCTNKTKGYCSHPLYITYRGMIARCFNAKERCFKNYGGRGISVCDRWFNSIELFISDMGEKPTHKHTLDRIDNNGNYEPSNCKWSTIEEQAKNRVLKTDTLIHGTLYKYNSFKCRCTLCKSAMSIYKKEFRNRTRELSI